MQEHAAGLVCLTGGDEGPLAAALERGGMDEGRVVLKQIDKELVLIAKLGLVGYS